LAQSWVQEIRHRATLDPVFLGVWGIHRWEGKGQSRLGVSGIGVLGRRIREGKAPREMGGHVRGTVRRPMRNWEG
jgi:hypothetical protein